MTDLAQANETGQATQKWVYTFGDGAADGAGDMKNLLGGKGAGLAEMSRLGLPVPPGFTITTEVCSAFYANDRRYPEGLEGEVEAALDKLGAKMGARLGDADNPLLVSVRSGARVSMPGMMDTVLNLGLNDETAAGLAKRSGDPRFAFDSYRRFIQMYSDVVLGVDHHNFEEILEYYKEEHDFDLDTELSAEDWQTVIERYKKCVEEERGEAFPQDPREQLWGAIGAVFGSWRNSRAQTYRRLHNIPEEWGTAVNVQTMVFGNLGNTSATGVTFTRNPSTGERRLYGEFLVNAQGEDVVAGIRTPQSLTREARLEANDTKPSMEEAMPEVYAQLVDVCNRLEAHYRDMQDIEFTVQEAKLWMLQTRSGKRTAKAALKIAVDLAAEGVLANDEAVLRVDPAALDQLLHPTIDPEAEREVVATGLPASPGAASGVIVFSADEAQKRAQAGEAVVLMRVETSPEDIHGMHSAVAIVTTRGGMTSHAAVVARGMGRPCVSGAGTLRIDYQAETATIRGTVLKKGDLITVDGGTGQVIRGRVPMLQPELSGDFAQLMQWADEKRRMHVRTNAETPADAETARKFGAEGIGLCRTEHMFFDEARIAAVRRMILASDAAGRRAPLEEILPMQRDDFRQLFEIMHGLPVTIRLLDPPLHEFLPKGADEIAQVAESVGMSAEELTRRIGELSEFNPMLGHRGCRVGVTYPEIYEMQCRAIFEGAAEAARETGAPVEPEIMIPLVAMRSEFDLLKERVTAVAEAVKAEHGIDIRYHVGTMIELPRACLMAGEIAEAAEFFSFGTNDLTQTTFGISRDDSAGFLAEYLTKKLMSRDPFVSIDTNGVGELVRLGAERGRATRPDIKLGICGEHGGDPDSIAFCEDVGLTYVSCSPFRVPIARLAAAQAALRAQGSAAS